MRNLKLGLSKDLEMKDKLANKYSLKLKDAFSFC